MKFSMRINFVDVICDHSLEYVYHKGEIIGFSFDIRLSYYRGLFLSCVDEFGLSVDGNLIPNEAITFAINGKEIAIDQLSDCANEFWQLTEPARIEVIHEDVLSVGEHDFDVKLMLRIPYLPIPTHDGAHIYMPLDSSGNKKLNLKEVKINGKD